MLFLFLHTADGCLAVFFPLITPVYDSQTLFACQDNAVIQRYWNTLPLFLAHTLLILLPEPVIIWKDHFVKTDEV